MEILCTNICFISLFSNMLFYWLSLGFASIKKYYSYFKPLNILSLVLLSTILILRWFSSGHFPLSNLYESLIFLAWTIQLLFIFLEKQANSFLLGVLISPAILFIDTFANFVLPKNMQTASALVPSLQSNWLLMHVTIMILSYGLLLVGCILSICYLGFDFTIKQNIELPKNKSNLLELFDDLSYRTIGIGFPLLTLGILSGAVWANETWGSYWNWDPKETWALITWFVFAIYLHTRLFKKWEGKQSAQIATVGFVILWICYLGVNLLGKGLHSYGWWS